MLDVKYFFYKPKFDKDIPVFVKTDTGEECRPCYDEKGYLKYLPGLNGDDKIRVKIKGEESFVSALHLDVKDGRGGEI